MHHFARNESLPQHAHGSLLLKVLHKAEVFVVLSLCTLRTGRIS